MYLNVLSHIEDHQSFVFKQYSIHYEKPCGA